ncbi:Fe(3+)-hydroxamate ABC transporter permease FhuB [Nisaea acidiphila]|uniref:Fe(3+)-hydroxamate ABC transporter permease FhuB n=1 Tax=Nisaea acidiphila TaxID=1862145 RepID=A0A9J7ANS7_9PROT|nr:Fe(3+)-hydroxamate ABC transporter permease FhuB [Nisaea acidiphila]UUX49283.1 Fe(3+)-hydroxamate ABC transporter permease FhuB [Nisaea acidiphila]
MVSETLRRRGWGLLLLAATLLAVVANLGPDIAGLGTDRLFGALDAQDIDAVLMRFSLLPRLAMAPLCGGALGLAGALFQQVLRNPLASPSTLGIEAGAGLAIALAILYQPALLGWGRDAVALGGAAFASGIVFFLAARFGFRPLAVILGGLIVGFYLSALSSTLILLNDFRLSALFIWGSGSLSQQDWRPFLELLPRVGCCAILAALLVRPMTVLQLDEAARGLGLRIVAVRAGALGLAIALTAFTVSAVGIVGFLGLAAPAIARALGARKLRTRMLLAPLVGACLLTLTDQSLQLLTAATGLFLPAGAVTAVLGAPILFLLIRQLPAVPVAAAGQAALDLARRPAIRVFVPVALLLAALSLIAVFAGRDGHGRWVLDFGEELQPLLVWRLPRTLASGIAGALLALAGVILQRLLRNPMASPEVLGVNAGAGFGLLVALICLSAPGHIALTGAATAGAVGALGILLLAVRKAGLSGNRTLLAGVALATFLLALLSVATATGDPRAMHLLTWMAGSTYHADGTSAAIMFGAFVLTLPLLPLLARQIEQLSAGPALAMATGAQVRRIQFAALLLAGVVTAVASLTVGALSFVGLIAPQIVRQAGIQRCLPHMAGAMLTGAALLVAADFLGRTIHFPWQLPAGLLSALIGGPVLALVLMLRPRR